MNKLFLPALLGISMLSAAAQAADATSPAVHEALSGEVTSAASAVGAEAAAFAAKHYSGVKAKDAAYEREAGALAELAASYGLRVARPSEAALSIEVDSTFYVYTNRFNARLVRVPEYAQAQLDGAGPEQLPGAKREIDVVRVAAGALAILQGWIPPAMGSTMVTGGLAPALFGSGQAPARLFVAGKDRYEHGEQEVNTKVRILREGQVVSSFGVRTWTTGDEPPFKVDELLAANWSSVMRILGGHAPDRVQGSAD